jgi:hypothetical protein
MVDVAPNAEVPPAAKGIPAVSSGAWRRFYFRSRKRKLRGVLFSLFSLFGMIVAICDDG